MMSFKSKALAIFFSSVTAGCASFSDVDRLRYEGCFLSVHNGTRANAILLRFNKDNYVDSKWDTKCEEDERLRIKFYAALEAASETLVSSLDGPLSQRDAVVEQVLFFLDHQNPHIEDSVSKRGIKVESLLAEKIQTLLSGINGADPAAADKARGELIDMYDGVLYPRYKEAIPPIANHFLQEQKLTIQNIKDEYLGRASDAAHSNQFFKQTAAELINTSIANMTNPDGSLKERETVFLEQAYDGLKSGEGEAFQHVPLNDIQKIIDAALASRNPPLSIDDVRTANEEFKRGLRRDCEAHTDPANPRRIIFCPNSGAQILNPQYVSFGPALSSMSGPNIM